MASKAGVLRLSFLKATGTFLDDFVLEPLLSLSVSEIVSAGFWRSLCGRETRKLALEAKINSFTVIELRWRRVQEPALAIFKVSPTGPRTLVFADEVIDEGLKLLLVLRILPRLQLHIKVFAALNVEHM